MSDSINSQAVIDVNGLDEEIRCEMCKNPIHTDRGCDGNCKYDEILYEKIIQLLNKRITLLPPAQPEIIRCKDCKHMTEHYDTDGNAPYWTCSEWDSGTDYDGFCHYAERREE